MFDDDEDINDEINENNSTPEEDMPSSDVADSQENYSNTIDGFENFDKEVPSEEEKKEEKPDPDTITVQPVQFASFEDLDQVQGPQNQNLNILLDVKLQLSVELGKAELPIKKVLELTKGSIVTLNKAAGEPVELYANGKLIAYGEVVVIEDNFGLRITHITDPVKRLNTINGGARED
jgi:flagellar motor switch protein FliN/FliY